MDGKRWAITKGRNDEGLRRSSGDETEGLRRSSKGDTERLRLSSTGDSSDDLKKSMTRERKPGADGRSSS
jgi:hypothetical protein